MNQPNYFFSYSRKDSDFVKKLATELKEAGANVWLDQLDIAPGKPWDDSIQNGLNESAGLIVVLSNASAKSKNVMDEVSYAMSQGKKVVPLIIENCPIPFRLARLQYIEFTGDHSSSLTHLLKTLHTPEAPHIRQSLSQVNIPQKIYSKKNILKPGIVFPVIISILIIFIIFSWLEITKAVVGSAKTRQNSNNEQQAGID